jgi:hydrogenase expression/formation protein HypD
MISDNTLQVEEIREASAFLLSKINSNGKQLAGELGRKVNLMEVCGTHTVAFARSGITEMVSEFIDLRSGPGCPICVTHQSDLDQIFSLTKQPEVIIVTFGDLLRVPGTFTTLEREKAQGARVQICYSPLEAVELAAAIPQAKVILIAIGFETTAPVIASAIINAKAKDLGNFWVYPVLKLVPPALRILLQNNITPGLDGLILPGHVTAILGREAFEFISRYQIPAVVSGFDDLDLLYGLNMLLQLIINNKSDIANAYTHVARNKGNKIAQDLINQCFAVEESTLWRGLGIIPASGLTLREEFYAFDARHYFDLIVNENIVDLGCLCGEIIMGLIKPNQCPLFGNRCTPSMPVGPCMVSPEGACGAYYKYL